MAIVVAVVLDRAPEGLVVPAATLETLGRRATAQALPAETLGGLRIAKGKRPRAKNTHRSATVARKHVGFARASPASPLARTRIRRGRATVKSGPPLARMTDTPISAKDARNHAACANPAKLAARPARTRTPRGPATAASGRRPAPTTSTQTSETLAAKRVDAATDSTDEAVQIKVLRVICSRVGAEFAFV